MPEPLLPAGRRPDVLIVSVAGTSGWAAAARELEAAFVRAGADTIHAQVSQVPRVRTFVLTDLAEARAARDAARRALVRHEPRAIVYCAITTALLWPRPGAIWLDTPASENRPGRHGVWQRAVERRRLAAAPLIMTMAERSLENFDAPHAQTVLVPTPVEPSGAPERRRDVDAVAYAADPQKRRLAYVLDAWNRARRESETLLVAGIDRLPAGAPDAGVQLAGRLAPEAYRALLRRARVYIAAPRREDYGIAPLEALADGCLLVTTPAPGPYPALDLARRLDPRLVSEDLVPAIRVALDDPLPGYAGRAAELLAPFSRAGVDRVISEGVLPRLLAAG